LTASLLGEENLSFSTAATILAPSIVESGPVSSILKYDEGYIPPHCSSPETARDGCFIMAVVVAATLMIVIPTIRASSKKGETYESLNTISELDFARRKDV